MLGAHILYPVENRVLLPFKHHHFSPLKNAFKNEHAFLSKYLCQPVVLQHTHTIFKECEQQTCAFTSVALHSVQRPTLHFAPALEGV